MGWIALWGGVQRPGVVARRSVYEVGLLALGGFFLGGLVLGGCSVAGLLREARRAESAGHYQMAHKRYTRAAQRARHEEAVQARAGALRALVRLQQWKKIPGAAARLVAFLDPEDPWYQQHKEKGPLWKRARQLVARTLLLAARPAGQAAQTQGNPDAYIASGRLFAYYLKHFPQGTARAEAALGRARALAVRGDYAEALPWFQQASKSKTKATLRDGLRGVVGCQIRLWVKKVAQQPAPSSGSNEASSSSTQKEIKPSPSATGPGPPSKRRGKRGEQRQVEKRGSQKGGEKRRRRRRSFRASFLPLRQAALRLVRQAPRRGPLDLLVHASYLERQQAPYEAMALLLLIVEQRPRHPAARVAQQRILGLFGKTPNWAPLLRQVQQYLARFSKRGGLFQRRLQSLLMLHNLRRARRLMRQRRYQEASRHLLAVSRLSRGHPQAVETTYRIALVLEEARLHQKAAQIYFNLVQQNKKHRLAPMALYRGAVALRNAGQATKAAQWFERLAQEYPQSVIASRALYEALQIYRKSSSTRRRQRTRKHLLRRYPRSMEARKLRPPSRE